MVYLHTNVYKYAGCNRQSMQTSTTDILAMATQKFSNPTRIKTRKKFTPPYYLEEKLDEKHLRIACG